MIDHLADVGGVVGVLISGPVHARAAVVDADQSHVEPIDTRHLPQRRKPVHRGAMRADDLSLLRYKDPVLPALCGLWPVGIVLPVQQHDVKVLGLRSAAQFVELGLRVNALVERGDFVH